MAVITRGASRFERSPIRAARARRRRFPWYFELDSPTLFMIGVTLLSLTCLLYLLQTSRVATLGYEIQEAQQGQRSAARAADNLRYEIAARESLIAVERHALTRLHMERVEEYEHLPARVTPEELRGPVEHDRAMDADPARPGSKPSDSGPERSGR
jgi:hypothetical protein